MDFAHSITRDRVRTRERAVEPSSSPLPFPASLRHRRCLSRRQNSILSENHRFFCCFSPLNQTDNVLNSLNLGRAQWIASLLVHVGELVEHLLKDFASLYEFSVSIFLLIGREATIAH
eukprot:IDg20663t1